VGVRFQVDALAKIDAWIAEQGAPYMSRPEAVRRLVEKGFRHKDDPEHLEGMIR
jgi:metal-responsive CopG/Arc/MetJ family transcriptional regulator